MSARTCHDSAGTLVAAAEIIAQQASSTVLIVSVRYQTICDMRRACRWISTTRACAITIDSSPSSRVAKIE